MSNTNILHCVMKDIICLLITSPNIVFLKGLSGFTSYSTQNGSFRRRSSQTISWEN